MSRRKRSQAKAPPTLSEILGSLVVEAGAEPLDIRGVVTRLRGRAYLVLVILLSLPFLTPIPLPGLSTPFGLAICFIALRLALGRRPWLPESILRRQLPQPLMVRVLKVAGGMLRFLEKLLRPRFSLLFSTPLLPRLHALLMLVAAAILLLPLPIPFSNSFPAWVVLLVAGGLLERDGIAILLAYLVFVLGTLYFVFLGDLAVHFLDQVLIWCGLR